MMSRNAGSHMTQEDMGVRGATPGADSGLRMDTHRGMLAECTAILGIARRRALCTSPIDVLAFSAVIM